MSTVKYHHDVKRYHATKAAMFAHSEYNNSETPHNFDTVKARAREIYTQRLKNYIERKPHAEKYATGPVKMFDEDPIIQILFLDDLPVVSMLHSIVKHMKTRHEIPVFRKILLEYIRKYKEREGKNLKSKPKVVFLDIPTGHPDNRHRRTRFVFPDYRSWAAFFFHAGAIQMWSTLPNTITPFTPTLSDTSIKGLDKMLREITEIQLRQNR